MHEPTICHEASGVVGVIKPAGVATQAPAGLPSVEAWLRERMPAGGYLGVPHRLDRAVSGIMLFASTPRAARQLSRQFERRQVSKAYLAVTAPASDGIEAEGVWTDWIEKLPDEPRARVVETAGGDAREAQTHVRAIGSLADSGEPPLVMLLLEPHTGRMHQLRVQAAARGLPIVGDTLYGGRSADAVGWSWGPKDDPRAAAIALHAWRITFTDPDTKQPITLEAPLSASWPSASRELLARAGFGAVTAPEPIRRG